MATKEYQIKIVNSILDNVHGFINLTEVENQIEKLPIFKRLQNISQLGLSYRIFPCALHNRYIHSLGVMHIVDQMALKLNIFNDNQRQLLRLAGMLHDIGHYPLSHDIEYVYQDCYNSPTAKKGDYATFITCKQRAQKSVEELKDTTKIKDYYLKTISNQERHHENIGTIVLANSSSIKEIIKKYYVKGNKFYKSRYKSDEEAVESIIKEISAIITGNAHYKESLFPDVFSVMVQLMHSEIDADRMDYLLRDSTFSGTSYGSFDFGLLIQTLEYKEYLGQKIVGVNLKGIGCVEQFLINRYLVYNQVINHKYTSIIGCILQAIVTWLIQDTNSGYPNRDVFALIEKYEQDTQKKYLHFTDDFIMHFINSQDENNGSLPKDIRVLLRALKSYKALNMVSEEVIVGNKKAKISKMLKQTGLYKRMIDSTDDSIDKIYQYREITITNQVPINVFDKMLKSANINDDVKKNERYVDRLMAGAAVIEAGKDPYLLVDSKRSMLRKIYGVRCSILREYDFAEFND